MARSYFAAFAIATLMVPAGTGFAGEQGSLDGRWLTEDRRAIVEIAPCGATSCGKIVWLKSPIDRTTGAAKTDRNNPDPALRQRTIIGLTILGKIVANESGTWNAISYDPRDGSDHEITVRLLADRSRIELKGCALGGLICESELWPKAPDTPPSASMNPPAEPKAPAAQAP